jgi:hypothetical protein
MHANTAPFSKENLFLKVWVNTWRLLSGKIGRWGTDLMVIGWMGWKALATVGWELKAY